MNKINFSLWLVSTLSTINSIINVILTIKYKSIYPDQYNQIVNSTYYFGSLIGILIFLTYMNSNNLIIILFFFYVLTLITFIFELFIDDINYILPLRVFNGFCMFNISAITECYIDYYDRDNLSEFNSLMFSSIYLGQMIYNYFYSFDFFITAILTVISILLYLVNFILILNDKKIENKNVIEFKKDNLNYFLIFLFVVCNYYTFFINNEIKNSNYFNNNVINNFSSLNYLGNSLSQYVIKIFNLSMNKYTILFAPIFNIITLFLYKFHHKSVYFNLFVLISSNIVVQTYYVVFNNLSYGINNKNMLYNFINIISFIINYSTINLYFSFFVKYFSNIKFIFILLLFMSIIILCY